MESCHPIKRLKDKKKKKANAAVCSEIRTKQSTQSEHYVEFLNVEPGGT
jgi:hypothetical protein